MVFVEQIFTWPLFWFSIVRFPNPLATGSDIHGSWGTWPGWALLHISSFMSLHIQMFKVVNCSNFDANWSTIIISQFACSKNYHSTESIWTFQFGLRAKNFFWESSSAYCSVFTSNCPWKNTEHFFAEEEYKNSVSVDEGSQTLALGIMVKLMWLDRILYSAGIEVIHIAYEQY